MTPIRGGFGVYMVSEAWIKNEVRTCRRRRLKENRAESRRLIGAFI